MPRLSNQTWALQRDAIAEIDQIKLSLAAIKPDTYAALRDRDSTPELSYYVDGNTAVFHIAGVLLDTTDWWTKYLELVTYQDIRAGLEVANADHRVENIELHISSPGGRTNGCHELVHFIHSNEKPIKAFGVGVVASAAYWIASACQSIDASLTTFVGSIGVILVTWKNDDDLVYITSANAPDKHLDAGKAEDVQKIQDRLTDLEAIFIADIAKFRSTTDDDVKANYGKGDVLIAKKALAAGMIDQITQTPASKSNQGDTSLMPQDNNDALATAQAQHQEALAAMQTQLNTAQSELASTQASLTEAKQQLADANSTLEQLQTEASAEEARRVDITTLFSVVPQESAFLRLQMQALGDKSMDKAKAATKIQELQAQSPDSISLTPQPTGQNTGDDFMTLVGAYQTQHGVNEGEAIAAIVKLHPEAHQKYLDGLSKGEA